MPWKLPIDETGPDEFIQRNSMLIAAMIDELFSDGQSEYDNCGHGSVRFRLGRSPHAYLWTVLSWHTPRKTNQKSRAGFGSHGFKIALDAKDLLPRTKSSQSTSPTRS